MICFSLFFDNILILHLFINRIFHKTIESTLSSEYVRLWEKRSDFELVILLDANSVYNKISNIPSHPLITLKKALFEVRTVKFE